MSTREAILIAALKDIPFTGFSDETLRAAAKSLGLPDAALAAEFPEGASDLVREFSHWADRAIVERLKDAPPEKLRARVTLAVRARLDAIVSYREAARRAAAFLALPQNAVLGAKLIFDTVDTIWRAVGDTSSDFSYYTKRASLAGVYGATMVYFLSDSSENYDATWAFLDDRINDIMRFEAFKKDTKDALSSLPDPLTVLRNLRPR